MSSQLVFIENNQVLTDSRMVAEKFQKNHRHVLESIRDIIAQAKDEPKIRRMFYESIYTDKYGREKPMYLMNRDGFTLLAMGFTGSKAMQFKLKYIEAFNAMEAKLKNQVSKIDPNSVLDPDLIIALATQLKEARQQLEIAKPKAKYYDEVLDSSSLIKITTIAKEYGLSGQGLNRLLYAWEIQYPQGDTWVLYQEYADKGYAFYEDFPYIDNDGTQQTRRLLKWTQKGREFLHKVLTSHGHVRKIKEVQK